MDTTTIDSVERYEKEQCSEEQAATHIGMYLAWAFARGFYTKESDAEQWIEPSFFEEKIGSFRRLALDIFDGEVNADDFDETGKAFTLKYYTRFSNCFGPLCGAHENRWEADDSWDNYALVCELLDRWFERWSRHEED